MPRSTSGGSDVIKRDGTFELRNVEPGAYYLMVTESNERTTIAARMPLDVIDENIKDLVVQLGQPLRVSGFVRVEGKEDIDLGALTILLRPEEAFAGGPCEGIVKKDGTFRIEAVSPDRYLLDFRGLPEGTYVHSVHIGGQDVLDKVLDLTLFQSGISLEISLSPKAGSVVGRVSDETKDVPETFVTLIPEPAYPERLYRSKWTTSDENGRFSIKGVAPGEYRLYAWEEPIVSVLRDPGFFKEFERAAAKASVSEGEEVQAEATLIKSTDTQIQ